VDEQVAGEEGLHPIASEADAQAARLRHRQAREEDPDLLALEVAGRGLLGARLGP
jgi:hypothetical protein